jgi:hypothetical protein
MEVFEANGFGFKEDEEGGLLMTAVPFSKDAVFGEQDVHELLHLLMEDASHAFRMLSQPSRPPRPGTGPGMAAGSGARTRGGQPAVKIVRPSRCVALAAPHGYPEFSQVYVFHGESAIHYSACQSSLCFPSSLHMPVYSTIYFIALSSCRQSTQGAHSASAGQHHLVLRSQPTHKGLHVFFS